MDADVCVRTPEDWPCLPLEDVCERITSGGTPSRSRVEYYQGGSWPWVKTQELRDGWIGDTEEHITDQAIAASSAKVLPPRTVLLALYGATVGQLGILSRPMTCNQACCALIVDPNRSDARYLFYQLRLHRAQLRSNAVGAAQQNLSGQLMRSFRLPFPPIQEQRAIAHILGTLDDKIELNRRMNETLEAMARGLFQSWFVDFDPVRAKAEGRAPAGMDAETAALFPDGFGDSALGKMPRGWQVRRVGEHVTTTRGRSYSSGDLQPSRTALVTLKSFARGGGYRPDGLKPYTGTYRAEQVVHEGDLVLACTDVTQAAEVIGRPALVRADARFDALVASLDVLIVRPAATWLTTPFLYGLFRTEDYRAHAYGHTSGTTVLHLGRAAVPDYRFACPPMPIVRAYTAVVGPALERVAANARQSTTLAGLRDALLPRLLSGEIRVKQAAQVVGDAT